MIYSHGVPLRKVKTEHLVDELFARSTSTTRPARRVDPRRDAAAEAAQWLAENEDATAMTPERLAAMEAAAAELEQTSPVEGRRFTRA